MNKPKIILISISFIGVIIWTNLSKKRALERALNMHFNGRVIFVDYNIKDEPHVGIDTQMYYLEFPFKFDHKIEVGDSMVKLKDSTVFKLIKHNTGQELLIPY